VAACFENIEGDIKIPDHPLVHEVMKDVLTEALDIEASPKCCAASSRDGFVAWQSTLRCRRNSRTKFSMPIPYAYLDDAPLEERRARAVEMRRVLPASVLEEVGALDPAAIAQVQQEAWPDVRDADELHDVLHTLVIVPVPEEGSSQLSALSSQETRSQLDARSSQLTANWNEFFDRLQLENRAFVAEAAGKQYWVAAERVGWFQAMHRVVTGLCPVPRGKTPPPHKH
jgi:ATP-dependent helicase Lhr and Lhr-like helicase